VLQVLQWLPVTHMQEIALPDENAEEEEVSNASKIASRYADESSYSAEGPDSRPTSAKRDKPASPIPQAPTINLALLTTTPLPSSAMLYAAAATGGGLASNEEKLCMPINNSDLDTLKPHLTFLLNIYGISYVSLMCFRSLSDDTFC
jgi:hypothetical protein